MSSYTNIDWSQCRDISLPDGEKPIHEKYGLWIIMCSSHRSCLLRNKPMPSRVDYYGLSHLLKGSGTYSTSDGAVRLIEEGSGVMVCPDIVHDYPGVNQDYLQDSIWFSGPVADHFRECSIIHDGVLEIGKTRRLLPIIELAGDPSVDSQIQANIELESLLIHLYLENRGAKAHPTYSYIEPLLEELKRTPERWWRVSTMAEYCNLSPSRFNVLFRKATGTSPKNYFDHLKMSRAAEQLVTTNCSVSDIGESLGYISPFHFSRRFKAIIGKSPLQYRCDAHSR